MKKKIDWPVTLFLAITPAVSLLSVVLYLVFFPLLWEIVALFVFFSFASSVSITAGYHRLLAHRAFKAKGWLKNIFLFFGAGAFQGPALKWVADHRAHHRYVDSDRDPYNIKRGFVFAHIAWLFYQMPFAEEMVSDLRKDRWIMWQYRYFVPLAIFSGFLLPMIVACLIGSQGFWLNLYGGFVFGAVARIVFVHHCTFFINSLCHMWGKRPYNDNNSARDNFVLALLTNGEGYHNFHHKFQFDYRNGVRWYQWDPTKWLISVLSVIRQTYDLQRVARSQIMVAKMHSMRSRLKSESPAIAAKLDVFRDKVEVAQLRLRQLNKEYQQLKTSIQRQSKARLAQLRAELKVAKIEFDKTYKQWLLYLQVAEFAV